MTQVENAGPETVSRLIGVLYPHTGKAFVLGITGSPGTGKSTLVARLAEHERMQDRSVGVIAVDPTSPFTGGAILGDRVRMQSLFTDPNVFIRSMATRGKMGGLTACVNDALAVLDAAGYETLILETVGVGQDEIDIIKVADMTLVTLMPGLGDDIQTIKAGIMEIGDAFVLNKADHPDTDRTEGQLHSLLLSAADDDGWSPPLIKTVAVKGRGVSELAGVIGRYRKFLSDPEVSRRKRIPFYKERLMEILRERLTRKVLEQISEKEFEQWAEKMMTRELDPYTIVDRLLAAADL